MTDRLQGKAALVTGAGNGIGRAIAMRYAGEGAHVMVSDINDDAARDVAREIGEGAETNHCDTSIEADVQAAIAATIAAFGKINVLVNNAGIGGAGEWDKTIAINLTGVYHGLKHGVEAMPNGGSIVSLSSMLGLISVPFPPVEAYTAAKHGVVGLTKHYATNYGSRGIRVNCINPGWIKTAMTNPLSSSPEMTQWMIQNSALGRMGEPEEVAGVALFLASDDSSFVTGASIVVDGGWTAR